MSKNLIGDKKVLSILHNLPKEVRRKGFVSASRKAAKPIVKKARSIINRGVNKTSGNLDGFKHLRALSKATKTVVYKGAVNVQIAPNTPDLPMASSREFWNAYGVAKLFAHGRGQGKHFRTTGGKGKTRGFGDWVEDAGKLEGGRALNIFSRNIEGDLDKIIKKLIARG